MERKQPTGNNRPQKYIAMAVLLGVVLVAAIVAGIQLYHRHQAQSRLDQLAEDTWDSFSGVQPAAEESQPEVEEPVEADPLQALMELGVPIPDKEVDIAKLQEEVNGDIYAWIYIPDSQIDYPVLQHAEDNSYYLNYNIDGSKGYPGCIYTENYNAKDFSDPNTVLYGHNMKNGSMFAGLHKFEDSQYFDTHPYVYIYTEEGLLVYEIFTAREVGDEHILFSYDFTSDTAYGNYLKDILEADSINGNIREAIEVTEENRIITLSTCVSLKPNNRYLVQGVLLNES